MQKEEYESILDYLRRLIDGTQWENHVFAVGGCCRDSVLGCEIKDIDLAVDLPDGGVEFAQWIFDKELAVKEPTTFPSFGTAMLRFKEFPNEEIEIVQTRREKYTAATRGKPSVVFGTIEEDCLRRDLTINALYYDISKQRMLDLLGRSISDIENHIIRTPDDPVRTFDDDPVRILRAIRFATRYGWDVDDETIEGMRINAPLLVHIRPERRQAEIEKIICGNDPARAMRLLLLADALPHTFPELSPTIRQKQNFRHHDNTWEHCLNVMNKVPAISPLRWAALFHGLSRRTDVVNAMRRYHYDRHDIDKVVFLIANHNATKRWGAECENMTDTDLRQLHRLCASTERFRRLLLLIDADNTSYAPDYCMPRQTEIIAARTAQLRKEGKSGFGMRRTLTNKTIRRIKGLSENVKLDVYRQFLDKLSMENPDMERTEMEQRLARFNPPKKSSKKKERRSGRNNKNKTTGKASKTSASKRSVKKND